MKKLIMISLLLFSLPAMASVYDDMAGEIFKKIPPKNRKGAIAVMPFNTERDQRDSGKIAVTEIEKALVNAGAVIAERNQIDRIIKEQELQMTGLISNEDASEVGQGVGARYILLGTLAVIDKYGESGNRGLKISVKLVEVSTYKIIAVSSGEASLSDASSKYKRQSVKKETGYPAFLELYGGMTMYDYTGDYDEFLGSKSKKIEEEMDSGYMLGIRYINTGIGFLTMGWEFNYTSQEADSIITEIDTFQISWIPIIRIPIWTYADIIPDYTNIYAGYALGAGINNVTYKDIDDEKSSKGIGFCSSFIAGLKLGLTDSIAVFGEFRYTPDFLNRYWRKQDIDGDTTVSDEYLSGPSFYAGLSFAP